ncbi:zinc finger protein [Macleaya cordata]|uniref:Zinc finger protein n=1 Tax=Macleaya cordata TaxID=56857 RepID=A0A200QAM2_MACCD|nr:zinc finger protein [Macleaya cordata]
MMNSKKEADIINNDSSSSNLFFTCEICIEPVPMNQKFKNMEMNGCTHPFCTDCIAKYIQVKVEENNASEIKCPDTNCNVVFDTLSCRSILGTKVFDKWCHMLCESMVLLASSRGGFAHGRAYCPFKDCSELVLNECVRSSSTIRRRITRSMCPNCKKLFCFHCMVPWQETHRCSSTSGGGGDVNRNHVLFVEMVKRKKWTRCPTCNRYVERITGYSHVTCREVKWMASSITTVDFQSQNDGRVIISFRIG